MNTGCELSVVFPTYQRPADVTETLALLKKNLSVSYEVFILDNSPSEHSFELAKNENYIFTGSNMGTEARNIGIEKASGEFVLMLDDDSCPLPGCTEKALELLKNSPPETAGITSRVERPDGGRENPPLLPTAFHGCGVLFRTEALRKTGKLYPSDFCFYGEEYWSTLLIYSTGFRLRYCDDFRVCHRMSGKGRDVAKILYYITRNNRLTWRPFLPEEYIEAAEFDTMRRYELISRKENVHDAYLEAVAADVPEAQGRKMSIAQFEEFSLIRNFRELCESVKFAGTERLFLCGCGKFPTLWAKILYSYGVKEIVISDLNPGLAGKSYGDFEIQMPESLGNLAGKGFVPVLGHSSRADADTWAKFLEKAGICDFFRIL